MIAYPLRAEALVPGSEFLSWASACAIPLLMFALFGCFMALALCFGRGAPAPEEPSLPRVRPEDAVFAAIDDAVQGLCVAEADYWILNYDGETARIEIAVRGAANGLGVNSSMVYILVREGAGWELVDADPAVPIDDEDILYLSGHVAWG
ncbi:hypothetical protein [Sanguibacter massiliensis]|uniref:hypothetical protein n=1 Tax=Sanguibacter massiliensis TaxID=1973217 RepID=UPI000C8245BE|nr:hypothetical protein [Sanguibacter massiliensis]